MKKMIKEEDINKYKRFEENKWTLIGDQYDASHSEGWGWRTLCNSILHSVTMAISYIMFVLILIAAFTALSRLYEAKMRPYVKSGTSSPGSRTPMAPQTDLSKVVSCYYNFPSKHGTNELMPSEIHPYLCTHINVAFARVFNKQIKLENYQYEALLDIVKLKHKNPDLKILLSVGGASNDNGFSEMVKNHASRKIFIKSIKYLLRNYTLDGIDLDWEFPALHKAQVGGRERQHFSQLLREIRMEYIREKRDYVLTVAVAAPQMIVDVSYDIDQLNQYVDYVNIMTYDFHYFTKYTPFTGFNSPLYPRASEQLYLATLNINYTVHMYMSKGLDPGKIVVGIPTYGHTFTLVNHNNHRVSSPASGFGSLGSLGYINYPQVCTFLANSSSDVTIIQDAEAKVPYLYRDKDWVSYDSPQSVMEKAKFIKDNKLRGAMIYSLNADDYEGVCEHGDTRTTRFPLSLSIRNTLICNNCSRFLILIASLSK